MENSIGRIIKIIGCAIIALGVIAGIVAWVIVADSYGGLAGFGAFIGTVVSFFVLGIMVVGFSEVIYLLEENNELLNRLRKQSTTKWPSRNVPSFQEKTDKDKDAVLKGSVDSIQPTETPRTQQGPDHKWLCNSCGRLRDQSPCPYCGNE